MKKFFSRVLKKKNVNLSNYATDLNKMNDIKLNQLQIEKINKNKINLRSRINNLNSLHSTTGKYSDNLSEIQIDNIVKKINEDKIKLFRDNPNTDININNYDIQKIATEFKNTKWKNKKAKLKKSREWKIARTISIIGISIGIWRGSILLAQEKNQKNMKNIIKTQVKQNNKEMNRKDKTEKEIKELKYENEQLKKLDEQAEIIGEAMGYLSDEELKFYLSLSAENRIRYLVEIGYLTVNVDGSLKLNSTSNLIIYLIIGFITIIIFLIIYFLVLK